MDIFSNYLAALLLRGHEYSAVETKSGRIAGLRFLIYLGAILSIFDDK